MVKYLTIEKNKQKLLCTPYRKRTNHSPNHEIQYILVLRPSTSRATLNFIYPDVSDFSSTKKRKNLIPSLRAPHPSAPRRPCVDLDKSHFPIPSICPNIGREPIVPIRLRLTPTWLRVAPLADRAQNRSFAIFIAIDDYL